MDTRENALLIHRGKNGLNQSATFLSEKNKGLKKRKPLADLSNTAKAFGSKQTILKDKPKPKPSTKKKNAAAILSDWDVQRCHEWGKEGIEHMHNNIMELQNTAQEQRVKKEVGMVVSSLRNWTKSVYDLGSPGMMKPAEDMEPTARLELEPEVVLSRITRPSFSGQELRIGFDLLCDDKLAMSPPFKDISLELHVEESDNE